MAGFKVTTEATTDKHHDRINAADCGALSSTIVLIALHSTFLVRRGTSHQVRHVYFQARGQPDQGQVPR
jgi:hypothetical protein